MPPTRTAKKKPTKQVAAPARQTLEQTMKTLAKAGSEQTRKTYARHGASEPMFGVSFATLKTLTKQIGVDHELALALWATGNFDARNLAVKIVDPERMGAADLDRWAREASASRMTGGYAAMLAAEGPHAAAKLSKWLAAKDPALRTAGWTLLAQVALRDEQLADSHFEQRLAEIERTIHDAPNAEREVMNNTLIAIGCRSQGLRKAALAASKRIGVVEVDHGDTACKTPDATDSITKVWAYATAKGFTSPAAQERERELPRLRC